MMTLKEAFYYYFFGETLEIMGSKKEDKKKNRAEAIAALEIRMKKERANSICEFPLRSIETDTGNYLIILIDAHGTSHFWNYDGVYDGWERDIQLRKKLGIKD